MTYESPGQTSAVDAEFYELVRRIEGETGEPVPVPVPRTLRWSSVLMVLWSAASAAGALLTVLRSSAWTAAAFGAALSLATAGLVIALAGRVRRGRNRARTLTLLLAMSVIGATLLSYRAGAGIAHTVIDTLTVVLAAATLAVLLRKSARDHCLPYQWRVI